MAQSSTLKQSRLVNASPIYYGWIVWAVATLGLIATSPGQSFTVFLFFDHFIEDFALSRTVVSSLYGAGTFIAALAMTWIGRKIDLHGNRTMGVLIGGGFAISLILLSLVSGPLPLLIAFIAIRGLGQGSLSLVNTTVIAQWFERLRGRMMSFAMLAFMLFQAAYVPWLQRQLEIFHWRQVWVILGLGVGLIVVPLIWILMRNRPEDYGLPTDGTRKSKEQERLDQEALEANGWTLKEVLRTPIFWIFIFGRIISPAWGTGMVIHQVSIFETLGHDARVAAQTWGLITLITAGFSLVFGWLVDKLRPGWVMAIQLGALISAMLLSIVMTSQGLLYLYAVAFAIMMAGGGVFDGAVWVNIFGRKHQGSIRGFVTTTLVAGTSIGPVIFGLSFDLFTSYTPVLLFGVVLAAIPLILSLFTQKPRRRKPKNA